MERRFWSGTFYLASGMIALMVLLPSLQVLLENRPVLWLFAFIMSSKYRVSDHLYLLKSLLKIFIRCSKGCSTLYSCIICVCVLIVTDQVNYHYYR